MPALPFWVGVGRGYAPDVGAVGYRGDVTPTYFSDATPSFDRRIAFPNRQAQFAPGSTSRRMG